MISIALHPLRPTLTPPLFPIGRSGTDLCRVSSAWLHPVVGIDGSDPIAPIIFLQFRSFPDRGIVDLLAVHAHGIGMTVGAGPEDAPRHSHGLPGAAGFRAQNDISHATGLSIEDDVGDLTDLVSLRRGDM
jgi:hypothetical protein